ncbi:hypothetical protein NXC14_CH03951 [Rhizobium sp. NXC14]|nr:hypothetical protein NXC14_CH03951 [Rhizobium sp. NXC14]
MCRGKQPKNSDLFWDFPEMERARRAHLNFPKRHFPSILSTCPALEFEMAEQLA